MKNIPIIKPYFGKEEEDAAIRVIRSGWITQGPIVAEFEKNFAEYVGTKYAIAVSSCTTALHLALIVAGIKNGDEVILPSHTFIATANVVVCCGGVPVFVDIDLRTFNMDTDKIEKAITNRTKAIMIVHQMGLPADNDKIYEIARKNNLKVIEDTACAIGSKYKGKYIGTDAALACFSFHPRKVLTTGEGGMITTNNEEYEKTLRFLRHHGMSVSDLARHGSKELVFEEYNIIGYNYRLTDLQAAIGIEQLKKLNWILERRRKLAKNYNKYFQESGYLVPPFIPDYAETNYQSYCAYINPESKKTRNGLMKYLLGKGITTRRGIMSVHREKPYIEIGEKYDLVNSEKASDNAIILPLYSQMTEDEQLFVVNSIKEYFKCF